MFFACGMHQRALIVWYSDQIFGKLQGGLQARAMFSDAEDLPNHYWMTPETVEVVGLSVFFPPQPPLP